MDQTKVETWLPLKTSKIQVRRIEYHSSADHEYKLYIYEYDPN